MTIVLKSALFTALFFAVYKIFVPGSNHDAAPAQVTLDKVRYRMKQYFLADDRDKNYAVIGRSAETVILYAAVIGLILGTIIFFIAFSFLSRAGVIFPGLISVILGLATIMVGLIFTRYAIDLEFKSWQSELLLGLPALFSYLPSFMGLGVLVLKESLEKTILMLPDGPLKNELERVTGRFGRDGKGVEALKELADKARHPLIDAVCFRLQMAWDTKVEPDMFDDLAEAYENEREKIIASATLKKKLSMMVIVFVSFIGAIPIYFYPIGSLIYQKMIQGLGW